MYKIMCLSDRLGFRGGAERQLSGLTYFLKNAGYDVQAVTYLKQSHPSPLELNYGMNYTCLYANNIVSKLFKVGRYIKKNKVDVVIAYKNGPTKLCCILKLLGLRFKLIVSERNTTQSVKGEGVKFFLYKLADAIVPNSYTQSDFISNNFPRIAKKVSTIINFVDVNKFTPGDVNSKSRKNCIIVASIKEQKNPLAFIKAVKLMKDSKLDVHIDWYGNVNDEALYKQCLQLLEDLGVNDYLTLKPASPDIHLEYPKYGFSCIPSLYEGFPNTLCEAMSCGLPVMASEVCDNPFILENGIYGKLFNPESPESIASAFKIFLEEPIADVLEQGRKNRQRMIQLCSEKAFTNSYLELIRVLMKDKFVGKKNIIESKVGGANLERFPKVIAFGCNHKNMLGLVRSLGEKGIRPYCVLLNASKGIVFESKYPAACHWAESPEAGFAYIREHFSKEKEKPILLSTDDVTETLFDIYASELRNSFVVPASNEDGRITYLMEKENIGKLAHQQGFVIPKMVVLTKNDYIPDYLNYPVFTKSVKSIDGGKKEENKCNSKEELENVLRNSKSGSLLVQQYIDKQTEWCLQGFTDGNYVFLPYVMKYLRYSDHAFGGYVELAKLEDDEFKEKVKKLVLETKYRGLFSVEFILGKDGVLYFTEINFRHDGYSYFTTSGNANLPYLYVMKILNKDYIVDEKCVRPRIIGMNESVDWNQSVKSRKISPFTYIYQLLTADSHLLWNKKDNGPIWYMVKKSLLRK